LVDHRFGRGVGHRRPHAVGVEHVADDRDGAGRLELRGTQNRAGHRRHVVPRIQKLGHERDADHARRAGQEHAHRGG
jgi:hypothetical protein